MTKNNVLASVLYRMAVNLKNQDFNKLIYKRKREELISSLTAMQFLTHCVGMKHISFQQADIILSVLRHTYNYETDDISDLLIEASDESDYSVQHEDLLFQMHLILSSCIKETMKKNKGYINSISRYVKGFHNFPRAFLSLTDKAKISPKDATEYSK